MKLTKLTSAMRKRRKLGAAVAYQLDVDQHMGAEVGKEAVTVYLGRFQAIELDQTFRNGSVRADKAGFQDVLWDDLMATVEVLEGEYADMDEDDLSGYDRSEVLGWGRARGKAEGLAYALAVLANLARPDIDSIRAETVRRWEAAQPPW